MARAAIFALPARYEPFGLAALDAASAGCALVLGDIPSLRETWDGAATFVPPDAPAALQSALEALIHDETRRGAAARAARRRAARYCATAMVDRYAALYTRLVPIAISPQAASCAS